MKSAPFNITLIVWAVLLASIILGGLVALIFSALGASHLIWGIITSMIVFNMAGILRLNLARILAREAGVDGPVPFAFSQATRQAIGLGISILSALLVIALIGIPFGFVAGALISLFTSIATTFIFSTRMMTKD